MKKLAYSVAVIFSLFAGRAFADTLYMAFVNGADEVPAHPDSPIQGMAVLNVAVNDDGTTTTTVIVGAFNVDPNNPINASHIHHAPPGVSGPIVCGFDTGALNPPIVRTCSGSTALDADELAAGNYYVNFHTPMNPGGEVRGNIVPVTAP